MTTIQVSSCKQQTAQRNSAEVTLQQLVFCTQLIIVVQSRCDSA
jgi:hypothetical protein